MKRFMRSVVVISEVGTGIISELWLAIVAQFLNMVFRPDFNVGVIHEYSRYGCECQTSD